jgi:hypothetical protein
MNEGKACPEDHAWFTALGWNIRGEVSPWGGEGVALIELPEGF